MNKKRICIVRDCNREVHAKGVCHKHYLQIKKKGQILTRTRYDSSGIEVCGHLAYVFLYDNNGQERGRAIIDVDDVEFISKYKWHLMNTGYAATRVTGKTMMMHRMINKTPAGYLTDHINRKKLDNRRSNLKTCNESENMENVGAFETNKSRVKGVYRHKATGKWTSEKIHNGKRYYFGIFDTLEAAKEEYDKRVSEIVASPRSRKWTNTIP